MSYHDAEGRIHVDGCRPDYRCLHCLEREADGCPNRDTPLERERRYQAAVAAGLRADAQAALDDADALDLIRDELSGREWSPDTLEVIAAYVRGTGRDILDADAVEVWTLTVEAPQCATVTTVHPTEDAALRCLFDNYDEFGNYENDMQALLDGECLVVHIESHTVVPS